MRFTVAWPFGGDCGPLDQRGVPAPLAFWGVLEAPCDAGSVEADSPFLSVSLVPEGAPVVIPPSGGHFTFTATLTNEGATPATLQAWARAVRPGGGTTGILVGPVTVTLNPGQSVSWTRTQRVPPGIPAGEYRLVAYVREFSLPLVDGASFAVTKEAPAAGRVSALAEASWPPAEGWAAGAPADASSEAWLPAAFALAEARPNPFTSRTVIGYEVPSPSPVRLAVYDVLGREVAVLVDGGAEAGRHEVVLDGAGLPSGTYLVRIEASARVGSRAVTLVR